MNVISSTYHKIMEKRYWKLGYVYLPEGDTFKNGVGDTLTDKQKEYFLTLCDKYMERYNDIFWDGLPFAMWRREDQIKLLAIIGFTILFLILYIYMVLTFGPLSGHTTVIAENIRVNIRG
jgi:hypothetical protein